MSEDAPPSVRVGAMLGHYAIVRALGVGGMGEIYEARDCARRRGHSSRPQTGQHRDHSRRRAETVDTWPAGRDLNSSAQLSATTMRVLGGELSSSRIIRNRCPSRVTS